MFVMQHGGTDLESYQLHGFEEAQSILMQVCCPCCMQCQGAEQLDTLAAGSISRCRSATCTKHVDAGGPSGALLLLGAACWTTSGSLWEGSGAGPLCSALLGVITSAAWWLPTRVVMVSAWVRRSGVLHPGASFPTRLLGLPGMAEHRPTGGAIACSMSGLVKFEEAQGSHVTKAVWNSGCCMQHHHASGLHGRDRHHT